MTVARGGKQDTEVEGGDRRFRAVVCVPPGYAFSASALRPVTTPRGGFAFFPGGCADPVPAAARPQRRRRGPVGGLPVAGSQRGAAARKAAVASALGAQTAALWAYYSRYYTARSPVDERVDDVWRRLASSVDEELVLVVKDGPGLAGLIAAIAARRGCDRVYLDRATRRAACGMVAGIAFARMMAAAGVELKDLDGQVLQLTEIIATGLGVDGIAEASLRFHGDLILMR